MNLKGRRGGPLFKRDVVYFYLDYSSLFLLTVLPTKDVGNITKILVCNIQFQNTWLYNVKIKNEVH